MVFDYSRLKVRAVEEFGSLIEFAKVMNWSERTLSLKLDGKIFWEQMEICKALELLDLDEENVADYFFTPKVQ